MRKIDRDKTLTTRTKFVDDLYEARAVEIDSRIAATPMAE